MEDLEISHEMMAQWKSCQKVFTLIDIREKEEREQGHMGGEWIPLSLLGEKIDELPSTPIVFYCRSGARSLMASKKLRSYLQRDDIYSLQGGMLALE